MTIQAQALNFADLFVDGCDTDFVMGAEGKVRAALPDGTFLQLDVLYRGRMKPSDARCEYSDADVPPPWYPERAV